MRTPTHPYVPDVGGPVDHTGAVWCRVCQLPETNRRHRDVPQDDHARRIGEPDEE